MILKFNTYRELKEVLKRLNSKELDEPVTVFPEEGSKFILTQLQIEEENFFFFFEHSDDIRTESELFERHGVDYDPNKYKKHTPKGAVNLYP